MVPGARAWRPPPAAAEDRNWINFANVTIEGWRPPSTAAENCRPAGAGRGGGRRLRGGRAAAERGDLEGLRARPTPGDEGMPTLIYPRKRHIFCDSPSSMCGRRTCQRAIAWSRWASVRPARCRNRCRSPVQRHTESVPDVALSPDPASGRATCGAVMASRAGSPGRDGGICPAAGLCPFASSGRCL